MGIQLASIEEFAASFADRHPQDILAFALDEYSSRIAISFSGAEGVVVVDMAAKLGREFRVFSLDTGRLQPETAAGEQGALQRHAGPEPVVRTVAGGTQHGQHRRTFGELAILGTDAVAHVETANDRARHCRRGAGHAGIAGATAPSLGLRGSLPPAPVYGIALEAMSLRQ